MCTDKDYETKIKLYGVFFGQDSHVSRFCATAWLWITFTVT